LVAAQTTAAGRQMFLVRLHESGLDLMFEEWLQSPDW